MAIGRVAASRATGSLSLGLYLAGFVLLAISAVSAFFLVLGHLGALSVPGCGEGSPCAEAAASAWGKVPGVGWPTSFLGFAYFVAAMIGWAWSRAGISRWLLAIVRLGLLMSLLFVAIIVIEGHHCGYCLASHAGNLFFWLLVERAPRRPAAALRAPILFVAGFAVVSLVLGVTEWREKREVAAASELDRQASAERIIAANAGRDPGSMVIGSEEPLPEPSEGAAEPVEAEAQAQAQAQAVPVDPPPAEQTAAARTGGFRGRYLHGPEEAPIRVVMLTDYQCVDCNRIEKDVRRLLAAREDVSLSIKHFPMSTACNPHIGRNMHPNACWAARAAEAGGILGGNDGFWKMHWWLFDHGGGFTDAELRAGVDSLGFAADEFIRVMMGAESEARVRADIEEGVALGLHYTPMIFVNGVELKGFTAPQALVRTVEQVAATDPPARSHAFDHPPLAAQKYIDDWRESGTRGMPADAAPRTLGAADAPVEIVIWGDLVEPYSCRADSMARALAARRGDVRYTYRHYPIHQGCNPVSPVTKFETSCLAAQAAEAAYKLGGLPAYWAMHTWISSHREGLTLEAVRGAATAQGLDPAALAATMSAPEVAAAIEEDARAGQTMGLTSLPLVLVNRRMVPRWDLGSADILGRIAAEAATMATRP